MADKTLDTYNKSANEFRKYFKGIGSRTKDIQLALKLAEKKYGSADVLELGCGEGRDATEIVKVVRTYTGLDYSQSLISLAKESLPEADFLVADMLSISLPEDSYDVIFAFASLLHIDKKGLFELMPKLALSLRAGGILYVSLKHGDSYEEVWQDDQFGSRLFYYYNPEIIEDVASDFFKTIHLSYGTIGHTKWFEMALRKK